MKYKNDREKENTLRDIEIYSKELRRKIVKW